MVLSRSTFDLCLRSSHTVQVMEMLISDSRTRRPQNRLRGIASIIIVQQDFYLFILQKSNCLAVCVD